MDQEHLLEKNTRAAEKAQAHRWLYLAQVVQVQGMGAQLMALVQEQEMGTQLMAPPLAQPLGSHGQSPLGQTQSVKALTQDRHLHQHHLLEKVLRYLIFAGAVQANRYQLVLGKNGDKLR